MGDRERNIRGALAALRELMDVRRVSSVWSTAPVGYEDQPDFLNMVVEARTTLGPLDLLDALQGIEAALGRRRTFRNAPRPMDIDILLMGERQIRSARLTVPHPRLLERGFALRPLAELAADLRHPVTGLTVAEHLARAERAGLEAGERVMPGDELMGVKGER